MATSNIICLFEATFLTILIVGTIEAAAIGLENSLNRRNIHASVGSKIDSELHRNKRALGGESIENLNIFGNSGGSSCASFVVALMLDGEVVCTGTILSNLTIATGSQCFQETDIAISSVSLANYRVAVGVVEIGPDTWNNAYNLQDRFQVLQSPGAPSSVALVYLEHPLDFGTTGVRSIPLITAFISYSAYSEDPSATRSIIGFGPTGTQQLSVQLNLAEVTNPILSSVLCAEIGMIENDHNSSRRALNEKDFGCMRSGACPRDVGGPILYGENPNNVGSCENVYLGGILVHLANPSCDSSRGISVYVNVLPNREWFETHVEHGYSSAHD